MKTYYVYVHHVVDADLYYVGQTNNPVRRFTNSRYETKGLYQYLDLSIQFKQNPNIETAYAYCADNENTARKVEDRLIQNYMSIGKCCNKYRSGSRFVENKNAYNRQLRVENPEYRERRNEYAREYHQKNRDAILERKRRRYKERLANLQVASKQGYKPI